MYFFLQAKLSSLHRYQPVAYLVKLPSQTEETAATEQDRASVISPPSLEERQQAASAQPPLVEISEQELPETQFIAVTAYQNDLVRQAVANTVHKLLYFCTHTHGKIRLHR